MKKSQPTRLSIASGLGGRVARVLLLKVFYLNFNFDFNFFLPVVGLTKHLEHGGSLALLAGAAHRRRARLRAQLVQAGPRCDAVGESEPRYVFLPHIALNKKLSMLSGSVPTHDSGEIEINVDSG